MLENENKILIEEVEVNTEDGVKDACDKKEENTEENVYNQCEI